LTHDGRLAPALLRPRVQVPSWTGPVERQERADTFLDHHIAVGATRDELAGLEQVHVVFLPLKLGRRSGVGRREAVVLVDEGQLVNNIIVASAEQDQQHAAARPQNGKKTRKREKIPI